MAVDRNVVKQPDLFDLSPSYGGDEAPLRGLALERSRDSLGTMAGVFPDGRVEK